MGTADELRKRGYLTTKVGSRPVCVLWSGDKPYAVDDRCPHMGFPLHRGTVDDGLLTCHWHFARFDLESGGTLDPFADDVRVYPVTLDGDDVVVVVEDHAEAAEHHLRRLNEGLEHGLSLVMAKAVLGLFDALGADRARRAVVDAGVAFGVRYRQPGWGAGLTVLAAMANVTPALRREDRPLALVHGLSFVSDDTRGRAPRFALEPLNASIAADRLEDWYRRFVDTRSGDAAERTLASAVSAGLTPGRVAAVMGAAVTDHVFVDGGHTIDFTNKAFEVLDVLGWDHATAVLPTLAQQMAGASRSEESGAWRHPHDLAGLLERVNRELPGRMAAAATSERRFAGDDDVDALAWAVLGEDPAEIVIALDSAVDAGATIEELARAVAYAAALRLARFHTQNDHGDWDVVHHAFTAANAVHQLLDRASTPELARGVYHGALRVFLDRFLNVPAARLPNAAPVKGSDLTGLAECWEREGMVDEAGGIVYHCVRAGSSGKGRASVVSALGSALLAEDAEFHWYQTYEAAVRQSAAWPDGSEQQALILSGAARFLAAHTPTRRELAQVVRIAARLRRGEALYEPAQNELDPNTYGAIHDPDH